MKENITSTQIEDQKTKEKVYSEGNTDLREDQIEYRSNIHDLNMMLNSIESIRESEDSVCGLN
jgi:hypothetical protein